MRTDEELITGSQDGDTELFGLLVRRHESLVRSVVIASLLSIDRVDDVVQETFVAAWQQIRRLRSAHKFQGWICAIARNLAANAKRQGWREFPDANLDAHLMVDSAEERLLAREAALTLEKALASIPKASREVIVLFYHQEESITRVALGLGISEAAAQKRISRARMTVREKLRSSLTHEVLGTRTGAALTAAVLSQICSIPQAGAAGAVSVALLKGNVMMKLASALLVICTVAIGLVLYLPSGSSDAHPSSSADPVTNENVVEVETANKPQILEGIARISSTERARRFAAHALTEPASPPKSPAPTKEENRKARKDTIRSAMRAIRPLLTECHTLASNYDPTKGGKVRARIVISGELGVEGLVSEVSIVERTGMFDPPNEEFEECFRETVLSVVFNGLKEGLNVSYPFVFRGSTETITDPMLSRAELHTLVEGIDDVQHLASLASKYADDNPQLATKMCDKVAKISVIESFMALHSCTIVACKLEDKERAVAFWLGVPEKLRTQESGLWAWASQTCNEHGITLPVIE